MFNRFAKMDKKIRKNIIVSFIIWTIGLILSVYFLGNHIATGFFGALMMISILLWVNEIIRKPTKHNSNFKTELLFMTV